MYLLFLDDLRNVDSDVKFAEIYDNLPRKIARNYDEFVDIIKFDGIPIVISFDMDLCPDHYKIGARNGFTNLMGYENCKTLTGLDCTKYLIQYCLDKKLKLPICYCHSQNEAGRRAILNILSKYKKKEENGTTN